jgi:sarcosine oxidase
MLNAAASHDVVIAGLGAMGSAAAHQLARRGLRVLGLDRYTPPHALGSSHGQTRIIREAYFENPTYVPMVQRAYELWRVLERASGAALLRETGGLMIGRPDSALVVGARNSAQAHGLRHEMLTASELRARFPALHPAPDMVAVWEPRAGILSAEDCVTAQLAEAQRHGAQLRFDEAVRHWEVSGDHVRVQTAAGTYWARRLVISAGAWTPSLLPDLRTPLTIERQVLHWFQPGAADAALLEPGRCPIQLWQFDGGRFFYGFPDLGAGVKAGFHHGGVTTTADDVPREVLPAEVEDVRAALRRFLPAADGPLLSSMVCLYSNTPDEHFLIDRHPVHSKVLIVSPCSGHGFKFAPVIGEIVADLVQDRVPAFDLRLFRWR